jgi:hypothetical protein
MPCAGTCQIEQHDWREDRIEHNPNNGAPYRRPGEQPQVVPANSTDAQIWQGADLGAYTELVLFIGFDFHGQWVDGVDREFPREGRQLDCKDDGCYCDWDEDKPKIIQDWPAKRTRYEVFVPHVWRWPIDGDPNNIKAERLLLKGAILHRKRLIQGICRRSNRQPVVPPFAQPRETEGG